MPEENHNHNHKKIILSVSSLIVIFMITSSIFMYMMFTKQTTEYNALNKKIDELNQKILDTFSNYQNINTNENPKMRLDANRSVKKMIEILNKELKIEFKKNLGKL